MCDEGQVSYPIAPLGDRAMPCATCNAVNALNASTCGSCGVALSTTGAQRLDAGGTLTHGVFWGIAGLAWCAAWSAIAGFWILRNMVMILGHDYRGGNPDFFYPVESGLLFVFLGIPGIYLLLTTLGLVLRSVAGGLMLCFACADTLIAGLAIASQGTTGLGGTLIFLALFVGAPLLLPTTWKQLR